MNRSVKILGLLSLFLISAAFLLGRFGMNAGAGFIPVADPTDVMFAGDEEPGALWIGIAMILLLAGLSASVAAIRCWIQNRNELRAFSNHASEIIPRG